MVVVTVVSDYVVWFLVKVWWFGWVVGCCNGLLDFWVVGIVICDVVCWFVVDCGCLLFC